MVKNYDGETDLKVGNKVERPSHYNKGKFEVIEIIEDWNCSFHLGNTIKIHS